MLTITIVAAPLLADAAAELTPSAQTKPEAWPYSPAELTLTNPSDESVESVRLRWSQGGPTLVWDSAFAPQQRKTLPVFLPAIRPEQTWTVSFRSGDGTEVASTEVSISWPGELVRSNAFLDPDTWRRWDPPAPAWSSSSRQESLLAVAMVCLAGVAALFIRRPGVRVVLVAGVLAVGTAVVAATLPEPVDIWTPAMSAQARNDGRTSSLLAMAARRTTLVTTSDELIAPVYLSRREMAEDDMLLYATDGRAEVPLAGGQVRLFRRPRE